MNLFLMYIPWFFFIFFNFKYYQEPSSCIAISFCTYCSPYTVRNALESLLKIRAVGFRIYLFKGFENAVFPKVEYDSTMWQKMQVFYCNPVWVQWSTVCSGWLLQLQWDCSRKCNTVNTCNFCSEKVCSVEW